MSKEEEYTTIEINTGALSEAKQLLMLSLINEGMLRERERIIELLEVDIAKHYKVGLDEGGNYIESLIARIKGEEDGSEPDAA
jgi:hypothetical protein